MEASSRVAGLLRRLRRKETPAAAEIRQAHRRALDSGEWTQPIRTMTFTALACETTGPDPARDRILSLGAVRIRGNRIVLGERFYQPFKSSEAVSSKEITVTRGLGRDEGGRGLPLPEALPRLIAFIGDEPVVGHGAEADVQFLNAALAAQGGGALTCAALDVRLLYRWWRRSTQPDRASGEAGLEEMAVELKLPRYPAHHAFYDALTAGLAFLKLLGELQASGAVQFRGLYREAGVY